MEVSNPRASRRAHRAHLTRVFGKVTPILESNEAPNERNTTTLQTALEQIEAKRTTISELDTKIRATIEDANVLETEILDTEEITFNIAEKITLIKAVLISPKPPNAQAPPLQPQSVQTSASVIQPQTPAHQSTSDHSSSTDTQCSTKSTTEE